MINLNSKARLGRIPPSAALPLLLGILAISGCSTPQEKAEIPRPVRVAKVGEHIQPFVTRFPGAVTARRETRLAFRIAGKLESRLVEVGDRVRRGQPIARLDAADFTLATQSLKAQLTAAKAESEFTRADVARYEELLTQNIIAAPEVDRRQTAYTSAKERVAALEAQLAQTVNQLRYTDLTADRDGVITSFSAETGDVVAAGQPVAGLSQLAEKEVTFHVPEHRIVEVKPGQYVDVTLWSQGERLYRAKIREIAPAADPATRTYRVKTVLQEGQDQARLGMTATVWLTNATPDTPVIPRSAVFTTHADPLKPKVWRVDAGTVKSAEISLGRVLDGDRVEVSGLALGQTIVSAGVHRLIEGQSVRVLAEDAEGSAR